MKDNNRSLLKSRADRIQSLYLLLAGVGEGVAHCAFVCFDIEVNLSE